MKNIRIYLSLMLMMDLCLSICTSCIGNLFKEDEDAPYVSPEWSRFDQLDQNRFYNVMIEEWTGFDEALYHDNKYIAVKTDMQNKAYVYSIGKKNLDERSNIYVVLNFDGSLCAFGTLENLMLTCYDSSDNLAFVYLNENKDGLIFQSTKKKHQYTGVLNPEGQTDVWKYVRNGLGKIPGIDILSNSYDFGKEWESEGSFSEISAAFATETKFDHSELTLPISITYSEWENTCNYQCSFLNDEYPEIIDVSYQDNNIMNVKVAIPMYFKHPLVEANIDGSHFSQGVIDNHIKVDCELISTAGKREVYSFSEELPISFNEGDYNTIVQVPIHVPNGKIVYLRPHVCPYVRFADDVCFKLFDKHHNYGYDFQYLCADGYITWRQAAAIGSTQYDANNFENNCYERKILFKIDASGRLPIQELEAVNVRDWGFAVFSGDNEYPYMKFSLAETDGGIQIDNAEAKGIFDLTLNSKYLTIDEKKYIANLEGWSICPYIDVKYSDDDEEKTCYGRHEPLNLTYNERPSITYNYTEYYTSYTRILPPFGPHIINHEEKIYGDAESEFYTSFLITGGFFIKKRNWIKDGTGWSKYCTAWFEFWNDLNRDEFIDGDNQGPRSFCWNMSNFECLNILNHHIEYETFCGDTGVSNVLTFVPVAHTDEKGQIYYFGYAPQISHIEY